MKEETGLAYLCTADPLVNKGDRSEEDNGKIKRDHC